jgi:TRAP-type C4-dicarboxylate transport system permease small subunit
MRNLFNSGIVGSDSLVKHLVLWVGFLGAGLATRERTHIRIDIASRVLPLRLKSAAQILVDVFSVVIGVGLVYASCTFVSIEYESGGTIPFMQIPVWVMELIIPIGFLVITLRFFAQLVSTVSRLGKGSRPK